jgi:hypothetical protein
MATSGAVVELNSTRQNKVASIKGTGAQAGATFNGVPLTDSQQQTLRMANFVKNMPKGSNLSVYIENTHATDDQNFILFDYLGCALARGAQAQGADIEITSTFAGIGTAAGYTALKSSIGGVHYGVLGTSFQFSEEGLIATANINFGNGNLEDYNFKNLQNYLLLGKDTYANDQKIINMSTELYINEFFAITGKLPAGASLNILFNVVAFANF